MTSSASITAAEVNNLLSGVKATLDTAKRIRKIYEQDYALEFNPLLSFFPIGENKFSEMIAYFLNPQARHGQGKMFLELLLQKFKLIERVGNFENPDVFTEYRIENDRRIDIYLSFDNGFQLAIENKLWAVDQHKQLSDYNASLHRKGKDYCLIYLTPYCQEPKEHSISKIEFQQLKDSGKIQCRSYADDFSELITEWIAVCRADKVKSFLKDLYQYIQHQINGEKFMGETDLIVDQLVASKESFKTAYLIQKAAKATMDRLLTDFKLQLEKIGEKNDWTLTHFNLNGNASRYSAFHFKINAIDADTVIAFEFGNPDFRSFYWGIYNVDTKIKTWEKGGELLAKHLGFCQKPEKYFLWLKHHEYENWDEQVFEAIRSRTFAPIIETQILDILEKYRDAVDENASLFSVSGYETNYSEIHSL